MMIRQQPDRRWACPGATLVLSADAERAEWLAARGLGLGGSDMAALMGESSYGDGTPWHVWAEKTGRYEVDVNPQMDRGRHLEPIVVNLFQDKTGIQTRRAGLMRSKVYPHLLSSVDRLTGDKGGLETKTMNEHVARQLPEDGECPTAWRWQARTYMAVTGRKHWHVAALDIDAWKLHTWVVTPEPFDEVNIGETVEHFWETYVVPDVEPPFDENAYTAAELAARWPAPSQEVLELDPETAARFLRLLDRRITTQKAKSAADKAQAEMDLELRALIGPFEEVRFGGKTLWTYKSGKPTRKVDWESLANDEFCVIPASVIAQYTVERPGARSLGVKVKLDQIPALLSYAAAATQTEEMA